MAAHGLHAHLDLRAADFEAASLFLQADELLAGGAERHLHGLRLIVHLGAGGQNACDAGLLLGAFLLPGANRR